MRRYNVNIEKNFMGTIRKNLVCSLLLILSQTSFSSAEVGRKTPDRHGTISAGPYYNPASKSYFELFRGPNKQGVRQWKHANARAKTKAYKNVQGRLATVRNLATHQFILRNFKGSYIWIGLQYFCTTQTLKWVDGTNVKKSDFTAWAHNWAKTEIRCAEMGYMPITYTTDQSTNGIARWQATGPHKGYTMYLVEYPTGKE